MNNQDLICHRGTIDHILDGGNLWIIAVENCLDAVGCRPTVYGMVGDVVATSPLRDPGCVSGQTNLLDFLDVFGEFILNAEYTKGFLKRKTQKPRKGSHLVTIVDGSVMTTARADGYKMLSVDIAALEDAVQLLNNHGDIQ